MQNQEDPTATPHEAHGPNNGLSTIAPDFVEQELAEGIDNIVPTRGYRMLPMVGLGGSAGSIPALKQFFENVPPGSGMVFVVILHLSPDHESILPELLARCTTMQVQPAQDGVKVEADCVYVIPPGKHLTAVDGHLRLTELEPGRGRRVAVDLFFRSLADTHGAHATAIVLSGADGDGAIGIKRVKERGGLTIAQDPDEAEHRSMPQSAINTGMVDWVLRAAQMPKRLMSYRASGQRVRVPPEVGPQPLQQAQATRDGDEAILGELLTYLRTRTGCDFSYYKRSTILRRISRRLQVNGLENLEEYLSFLRTHPGESGALQQDMLISVTNFFRDPDAFEALKTLIPELFKGKGPGDVVRVWTPGCATGEETYSMAMLLLEHAGTLDQAPSLQVFGCDLDEDAVQVARAGLYPATITADVSEERLRKFFTKESHGYRIRREVRELMLFAAHDLLKDAPFSRMDLISCRNLLIYLNRNAQARASEIFHFALGADGVLFLGSSESVADGSPLFGVLHKKHRIYRRQSAQRLGVPMVIGPNALKRSLEAHEKAQAGPVIPGRSFGQGTFLTSPSQLVHSNSEISIGELHFRLLERYATPSVFVNKAHDIVHISANAGRFLQFTGGEPTMNLLRVVDPTLRSNLRVALAQAAESGVPVHLSGIPLVMEDGLPRVVDVRVLPAGDLAPGFLAVVFEMHAATTAVDATATIVMRSEQEPESRLLERELEVTKLRLRDMAEQYEANTEELKARNEELQAMNEELRSASEELETSREELQSINEELSTVNQELKGRLQELGEANSDLHNLMAATGIATVFLDRNLRIKLFTPSAVGIFRILPGDIGRPFADLTHQLDYPKLTEDALRVLEQLIPVEREVWDAIDRCYLARWLPYRTLDDRIARVVLACVDITERKSAELALRHSEERLNLLIESAKDYAIFTIDLERRVNSWNSGAETMFGYEEHEIIGQSSDLLFTPEDREHGDAEQEAQRARDNGRAQNERWLLRKDGSRLYGSGSVMPMRDKKGTLHGFVKIMRDLSDHKRIEQELEEKARLLDLTKDAIIVRRLDDTITLWNKGAETLYGWTAEEAFGKHTHALLRSEFPKPMEEILAQLDREGQFSGEVVQIARDGRRVHSLCRWVLDSETGSILTSYTDVSDRQRAEALMRQAQEQLERQAADLDRLVKEKTKELQQALVQMEEFSYTVSHDLRSPLRAMQSFAQALLEDYGDRFEPEGKEYLERISAAATRMQTLTNDVLNFSKVATVVPQLQPVSLDEVVREILRLTPISPPDEVTQEGTLPTVLGERALLSQVISNLLNNAKKFVRPGTSAKIRLRHELRDGQVRLWIEDNGIGIDPSCHERLFQPFERCHPEQGYEGTGIGLAIVRKAVERMGGKVGLESDGKTGSRFWIELPGI